MIVTNADARTVVCPNCNAQPHHDCTQPTDFGRVSVRWTHFARGAAYVKQLDERLTREKKERS